MDETSESVGVAISRAGAFLSVESRREIEKPFG